MDPHTQQSQQPLQQQAQQSTLRKSRLPKIFITIAGTVILFTLIGGAYSLGVKNGIQTKTSLVSQPTIIPAVSPTPTQLLTAIPSGTMLPSVFTQTSWKTYTSPLGVSFAYPPNFELWTQITPNPQQGPYSNKPTITENSKQNLVEIDYAYSYLFRITKITTNQSLQEWVSKNDGNFAYHSADEYQTTFNSLPAILSLETPEMVKNAQVPETTYYVKTNVNSIYQIEYAIPITIPSDSPDNGGLEQQSNNILTTYIPQILGSIKFQ